MSDKTPTTISKECTNPRLGKLLAMYEFGALDQSERRAFLQHLLDCEYCHDQVYSMEPVAMAFRKHRAAAQQERTAAPVVKAAWGGFPPWLIRRAIPATVLASAVLLGALIVRRVEWTAAPQADDARLASSRGSGADSRWTDIRVPKPGYIAPANRVIMREPEEVFVRAMAAYERDDLNTAIELLQTLSEMHPNNPGEVSFYEGVSLLLAGRSQDAIGPLKRALESGDGPAMEKRRYYLALAYLKRGQPQPAMAELEAVIEMRGEYLAAASELRERVSNLSQSN